MLARCLCHLFTFRPTSTGGGIVCRSFWLRAVASYVPKFLRPSNEPALSADLIVRARCCVGHPIDRAAGQFACALFRLSARFRALARFPVVALRASLGLQKLPMSRILQPELDQPADGFGARRRVFLFKAPFIDRLEESFGYAHLKRAIFYSPRSSPHKCIDLLPSNLRITRQIGHRGDQAAFLLGPSVFRRCATEAAPKTGRLSNASSDVSRTSPIVFKPAANSAFFI